MKTKLHNYIVLIFLLINSTNQDTIAQNYILVPPDGVGNFEAPTFPFLPNLFLYEPIASPYRSDQRNNHYQTIFTKEELIFGGAPDSGGCQMSSIGFNIFRVINADFYNSGTGLTNYTIKLRNIPPDTFVIPVNNQVLSGSFIPISDNYIVKGPFNVDSSLIDTTGFHDFILDIPFDWDGTGNVLLDIRYGENSGNIGTNQSALLKGATRLQQMTDTNHYQCAITEMFYLNPSLDTTWIHLISNLKPVTRFGFVPNNNEPPCDFLVSPSSPVICVGESVILSANDGATNYSWSPNTGLSTTNESEVIASPLETTTYTITGTTGECESIQTVTITVNPVSELAITQDPENAFLCSGPISLSISSSFSNIEWSNGINDVSSIEINTPGTYTVTATNEFDCLSSSPEITIDQGTIPEVNISPSGDLFLCNGNVILTANSGLNTYVWSNGATGNFIEVNTPGEYHVSAQNNEGCIGQSNIVIVNPSYEVDVEITAPTTSICAGNPVTISTNQTFAGYNWSNGGTGNSISVTQSGDYSLTVTDENGCIGTSETISIEIVELPIAGFTYEQTNGYTIDFSNTSIGGITFSWDFAGGNSSTQENPSFTYPFEGFYPVTLIVTNDCGSDTIVVSIEVLKLSIGLNPETSGWTVFPNPFNDILTMQPNKIINEDISINILNVLGQEVYKSIYFSGNQSPFNIPVKSFSNGVYFIRLETKNESLSYKIIKR